MSSQTQERIPPLSLKWRLQMSLDMAGIGVEEMAAQLDVSRSTISRWLNGHGATPKRPFLIQWARMTSVPFAWLDTGQGSPSDPEPGISGTAEARVARLAASKRRTRPYVGTLVGALAA